MTIEPTSTTTTTTTTTTVPLTQPAYQLEKDNETGVKHQGPRFKGDIRVPTAQGLALGELISQVNARRNRLERGWIEVPSLQIEAPRKIVLGAGTVIFPNYPGVYSTKAGSIDIPTLDSSEGMIKRKDYLYAVSLVAHVGADIDPALVVTFAYRPQQSEDIKVDQKENEQRFRTFTGFVLSPVKLTPELLYKSLTTNESELNSITIQNKSSEGFPLQNNLRFYALDENWKEKATYPIEPKLVDIIPCIRVKRIQNVAENGIVLGKGGEEPFTKEFNIIPNWEKHESLSPEALLHQRLLLELFAGKPGKGGSYERAVVNLASGPIGGNLERGFPGIPASTPNGSVALPTGQRLSISNQAVRQNLLGDWITAGNDGQGNAELVFTLTPNVPVGTKFNTLSSAHRIISVDGQEIQSLGTFRNLGGTAGSLVWVGGQSAKNYLLPGQKAYFLPAIDFPSGSGTNIPFKKVSRIWLNARELDKRNVRISYIDDPQSYETPANGEQYIVTVGPERGAIPHYILAHMTLKASEQGILLSPNGMGCIAFVEKTALPNGQARIDQPVVKNLSPNTDYRCLVYKAPLPSESWQFELLYPDYEGVGNQDPSWLNNATIASLPFAFAHTQGSGTSVFQGEGGLRYAPIAAHLPVGSAPIQYFQLDSPIQWLGEGSVGDITFRQMPIIPAAELSLPIPGQKLIWDSTSSNMSPRSMNGTLKTSHGHPIGFRTPKLFNGGSYQAVFAFLVKKDGVKKILVVTQNTNGNENVVASSDQGAGIDLFDL